MEKKESLLYTIEGRNPLANFGSNDSTKTNYSQEELYRFYYAHHPEVQTTDFDTVKEFLSSLGTTIQQIN